MSKNIGKKFEQIIREAFEQVPDVSVDRVHDQTTRYKGSTNICDFIVYKYPRQYYIECKTVHGNILPFSNITDAQWQGLYKKSKIKGVSAGVICWWVDKDITRYLPIHFLCALKYEGQKSIRYDFDTMFGRVLCPEIVGKKKRTYFDYDMEEFFNEVR